MSKRRPQEADAPPRRVWVQVAHIGAGVWCRIEGVDTTGAPLALSGAVVAGPDLQDGLYAVAIRDYVSPHDQIVYTELDGMVELADEPSEHAARRAHAIAPVLGPVEQIDWLVHNGNNLWVRGGSTFDPTEAEVAAWEHSDEECGPQMSAVHRGHLPIADRPGWDGSDRECPF